MHQVACYGFAKKKVWTGFKRTDGQADPASYFQKRSVRVNHVSPANTSQNEK
jgi:hypothetical protein